MKMPWSNGGEAAQAIEPTRPQETERKPVIDFSGSTNILQLVNALKMMDRDNVTLQNSAGQTMTGMQLLRLINPLVQAVYATAKAYRDQHGGQPFTEQQRAAYEAVLDPYLMGKGITSSGGLRATLARILSSAPSAIIPVDQEAIIAEWNQYDPTLPGGQ